MFLRPALQRAAAPGSGISQFCLRRTQDATYCRARANVNWNVGSSRGYATGQTSILPPISHSLRSRAQIQPYCRLSAYNLRHTRGGQSRRGYATQEASDQAASQASPSITREEIFKKRREMYSHRNKTLMMYSTAVLLFMGGMSYAAVPLYRAFCAATGFAGTPIVGTGRFSPERLVPASDSHRIRVRFNADTSEALPWQFIPQQKYVDVLPGETSLAFYKARNKAPYDVIGIATYNVTPDRIAPYFAKVECFCFEEQKLLAGEEVDMPLLFFIDRDVLEDPTCKGVDDVVLSYTFFRARRNAQGQLEPDAPDDVVQASLGFDKYEHAEKKE